MDNREKILDTALELFYARGYDAVGVQEIAEAAGVTKPTLYHYFGSKYGLLESLLEVHYRHFEAQVQQAGRYEGDLPVTLYRIVKCYFGLVPNGIKFYALFMAMIHSAKGSDTYRAVAPYAAEQLKAMTALFLQAGHSLGNMNGRQEQYAMTLLAMIGHNLLLYMGRGDETLIDDERAFAIVHQFLHGIYV